MRNIFFKSVISSIFIISTSLDSFAQDKKESPWSGNIEIGYSASKGNTDELDLSLESKVIYAGTVWKHSFSGESSIYENSGTRLSEEIALSYDVGYFINSKNYFFNHVSYEKDIAENIDRRIVDAIGYGRIFIKNKDHNLTSEIGVGKRDTKYLTDKEDSSETIGYVGVFYDKKIAHNISLDEELLIIGSSDNQVSKSTTGLNFSITENLSITLRYKIEHASNPPEENKKTDSTTDISLGYSF